MPRTSRMQQLEVEVGELRQQLEEATATLDAIRRGEVDALVVGDSGVERVYTLEGAEYPYRVLIEAMQQGAATVSVDGTILFSNRCLATMLEARQENISGSSLERFVVPAERRRLQGMLRQAQTSPSLGEINFQLPNGGLLPVQLALSMLPLPDSAVLGLIVTDLTDQRHQEELEAAHRRKDDFLAILAHELRNPLAAIRNALHLLSMPAVTEDIASQARALIDRQVENLTRLVDELLDVSRISMGKIQLRKMHLGLAGAMQRAEQAARPLMDARKHLLSVEVPTEPLWIEGDPTRIEQVLVNLLNNAAKYTEVGGRVRFTARRQESDVLISIRDSGIGIEPELLPRVFDLFTQADHSLHRTQGGLGIGLTLVRSLVELHGGSITARSDGLGEGSEFTVRLPLLPPERVPSPPAEKALPEQAGRRLRVVVVDDNADARESLGQLLRLYGHELLVLSSGEVAIQSFAEFRPDVVLLDIGLPDIDGYQVAQRIRALPDGTSVRLVAVTGYGHEEHRRRAAAAGFDHHLVKPVKLAELQELLVGSNSRH
jgi:PAS domain S-box-containing protein